MYIRKGEVRKIGIEVVSQLSQEFKIDSADFSIMKISGEAVENGMATIEEHKILTLFSAQEIGKYYCEFTYRIGPEILKAKIYVEGDLMKYTANYTLKKPDYTDPADIADINANMDSIDTKIKANETAINTHKADTTKHITAAERNTWNGKQPNLGYTPVNRGGDAMAGILTMQNNTSYTVAQGRNIIAWDGTGTKPSPVNGALLLTYTP